MKAKEKAEELVNKYNSLQRGFYKDQDASYGYAKQCTIIAVDEILHFMDMFNIDLEMKHQYEWWKKVKQEIENL
jgi:hypothetical protein